MPRKLKALDPEHYMMEIVEDLGNKLMNGRNVRRALFKCSECPAIIEASTAQVKSRGQKRCSVCANGSKSSLKSKEEKLEQFYQRALMEYAEERGAYVVKVSIASKKGVPDLLMCYKGMFIAVEVKRPGRLHTATPLQKYNLEMIKKAGGISLVASDVEQIEPFFSIIDTRD